MPTGPQDQQRPADVIGNAILIAKLATGELEEGLPPDDGTDPAAVSMGKRGGAARAKSMTPERRRRSPRLRQRRGGGDSTHNG